jgi:hypothetical protein
MDAPADRHAAISREADELARALWDWLASQNASSGAVIIAVARCMGQLAVEVSSPEHSRGVLGVLSEHAEQARRVKVASDSLDAAGLGALNPGRRA